MQQLLNKTGTQKRKNDNNNNNNQHTPKKARLDHYSVQSAGAKLQYSSWVSELGSTKCIPLFGKQRFAGPT